MASIRQKAITRAGGAKKTRTKSPTKKIITSDNKKTPYSIKISKAKKPAKGKIASKKRAKKA